MTKPEVNNGTVSARMKLAGSFQTLIKLSSKLSSVSTAPSSIILPQRNSLCVSDSSKRSYYRDITDELQDGIAVTSSGIKTFLNKNAIDFNQGYTCLATNCSQSRNCDTRRAEEGGKILINNTTGSFLCTECLWSCNWQKFEKTVDGFRSDIKSATRFVGRFAESSCKTRVFAFCSDKLLDELSTASMWRIIYSAAEEELTLTENVSSLTVQEFEDLVKLYRITASVVC